jgi:glycosyltransferase involved in cell wall biosynthesis
MSGSMLKSKTTLSRTAPCWCGSGMRLKSCHGTLADGDPRDAAAGANGGAVALAASIAKRALDAQKAEDLSLAESLYRECLALDPQHADALHMLGIVRLGSYDFAESRRLIEAAGALTEWRFAPYRHNYGYVLSAYLPACSVRPTAAQRLALQARRAQYSRCEPMQRPTCTVLVHRRSLSSPELPANTIEAVTPDQSNVATLQILNVPAGDTINSCASVHALLRTISSQYVAFASTETPLDAGRTSRLIAELEASRAGWGFSTLSFTAGSQEPCSRWPAELAGAAACLSNTQYAENVSAMCFATPLLPLTVDNLVVRRSLLLAITWPRAALTNALADIVLALCRQDEPFVCTTAPLLITETSARALANDFARLPSLGNEALRCYITDTLACQPFANPLTPSLNSQGLSFLKRPLRHGVGAALDAAILSDIARRVDALPAQRTVLRTDGFDLVGFARAESGLGENVRAFSRAMTTVALPHSVIDIDIENGMRKGDDSLDSLIVTTPTFRHQIVCMNPDVLNEAIHNEGVGTMGSAYKIGYWLWELEKLPQSWTRAASAFQELWAASDFVRQAVANSVSIPVYMMPTPIRPPQPSRPYARAEFGLDDQDFVFLFSFAYGSMIARKNPWATVRAFREAFPANDGKFARVKLVVKSVQSELFEQEKTGLRALAADDPRIIFMDQFMSRDQVMALQVTADCYVSLHRSEGFGLGMAECMAVGKPVIGTAYSANLDFMNDSNSLLVNYALIPVKPGEYPDTQAQLWADADVECAARHMRSVFNNAALRVRLGSAAKRYMEQHYSPRAVGVLLDEHLNRLKTA